MKNMATELGIILIGYFTLVPAIQVRVAHGFGFAEQSLVGSAGPQQDLELLVHLVSSSFGSLAQGHTYLPHRDGCHSRAWG